MNKLTTNPNRLFIVLAIGAALIAVAKFPSMYPERVIDVPLPAFFLAEVGLALLAALLFYDHATIPQVARLAASVLGFALLIGAFGNQIGQSSKMLPDDLVLMNWVQLAIMNVFGILCTLTLFKLEDGSALRKSPAARKAEPPAERREQAQAVQAAAARPAAVADLPASEEAKEKGGPGRQESAQELLDQLDVSRINKLERSLKPQEVSLEALFREENQAAMIVKKTFDPGAIPLPGDAEGGRPSAPGGAGTKAGSEAKYLETADLPPGSLADFEPPARAGSAGAPPQPVDASGQSVKETMRNFKVPTSDDLRSMIESGRADAESEMPTDTLELKIIRDLAKQVKREEEAKAKADADKGEPAAGKTQPKSVFQKLLEDEPFTGLPDAAGKSAEKGSSQDTLFDRDADSELDDIFKNLVPETAQKDVSPETLARVKSRAGDQDGGESTESASPPAPEPIPLPAVTARAEPAAAEADAVPEPVTALDDKPASPARESKDKPAARAPAAADTVEVKEFGRLSAGSSTGGQEEPQTGTMKTIGKMLIDQHAVENIIKAGEAGRQLTTARVLSEQAGGELGQLLARLDESPGVVGSVLVGHDGLVIASTLAGKYDTDSLGVLSLAILGNSNLATEKLEQGRLRIAVLQAVDKATIIIGVPPGAVAVLADNLEASSLPPTLERLNALLKQEYDEMSLLEFAPAEPAAPAGESTQRRAAVAADLVRDLIESMESGTVQPPQSGTSPEEIPLAEAEVIELSDSPPAAEAEVIELSDSPPAGEAEVIELSDSPQAPAAEAEVIELGDSPPAGEAEVIELSDFAQAPAGEAESSELGDSPPAPAAAAEAESSELSDSLQAGEKTEQSIGPVTPPAKEVKEFGRLSSRSSSAPAPDSGQTGTMKTIGKMLVDAQAVANIIRAGEQRGQGLTTARVISASRGEGIRSLLSSIDSYAGVSGSLIVGHDGLVIASTVQSEVDKDLLGAMSVSIHAHTNVATEKLELGQLQQSFFFSAGKLTVLTAVDVGILAVFADDFQIDKIDGLIEAIEATIRG